MKRRSVFERGLRKTLEVEAREAKLGLREERATMELQYKTKEAELEAKHRELERTSQRLAEEGRTLRGRRKKLPVNSVCWRTRSTRQRRFVVFTG